MERSKLDVALEKLAMGIVIVVFTAATGFFIGCAVVGLMTVWK